MGYWHYVNWQESEHPPENTRTQRPITKKRKQWTSSENREVLMCYFKSEPSQRGYRKRFHALWIEHHPESDTTEQRLADQQKTIIRNNWFSETEIDEIKRHANSRNVTPARQGTEEEIEDNDGISLQVPQI